MSFCFQKIIIFVLFSITIVNAKYYSLDGTFNVQEIDEETADILKDNDRILAVSQFRDEREATGWTYLTVTTNKNYADWKQAYGIGFLESYHAYELIYASYKNHIEGMEKKGFKGLPSNASDFMSNQYKWAVETAYKNRDDPYWDLVNATIAQFTGIYDGYMRAVQDSGREDLQLTFDQLYLLTYIVDVYDILRKYTGINLYVPSCSALVKLTEDSLYAAHTTWTFFDMLLRTYKIFNFNFKNPLVNIKRISFTSQPGSLPSLDNYYIIDNNRVIAESTLETERDDAFEYLHYDSLPYWIRLTVANLGFTDQKSWADIYLKHRSGTANAQWLIIDFNSYFAFKNDLSKAKDIVWIVEEFYSLTSSQDVTQELLIPQGYVASYNAAYDADIQALSEKPDYTTESRYTLFKKYAPGIKNLEDVKAVIRMNNISDTNDYCLAIAGRCDLSPKETDPWGSIDGKVTSDKFVSDHKMWIVSSPTTSENIPPFTWDDWPNHHVLEIPRVLDFDWVFVDPNRNFSTSSPNFLTQQKSSKNRFHHRSHRKFMHS